MKKSILTLALLLCSVLTWASPAYEEWYKKMILEGQQKLAAIQEENAINDANGLSDRNHYLILVGSDNYPDGKFITQRKGINRGSGDDVHYLLDEQKINSMDNMLSTMNSTSEIKTYVLVVSYIPMEFGNELSADLNIADFFQGHSTDLAKPFVSQAAQIVSDITTPILSQSTTATLYCGFVNFKVFKNEYEGLSQWVYYPRNNNVKYDEEYQNILSSAVSRAEWPSGSIDKVDKLVDLISTSNTEYTRVKGLFADLIAIDHPIEMEQALKGLSINSLSAFNIGLRLHILKVLSAGITPGDRELLIINLINSVQTESDANQLLTGFKLENDKVITPNMKGWCLIKCMTSQTSDGLISENYKALIKSLVALCKRTPAFKDMVGALNDNNNEKIADRTVYYNYNSFWSKMASTMATFPRPLFDRSTVYASGCQLETSTQLFFKYILPSDQLSSDELDPLEPIVFVNQSDLGMLGGFAESNIFVSPAIILKYADEKAWNQTASDVSMAAIDAASLATGYGEIKAGVMGVRKAWVLADMANSGINLSLKATLATENPTVKKILDLYNVVTGGVAITRMVTGSLKGAFSLIKGKDVLDQQAIFDLLKALDDGGDDALKSLSSEEFTSIQAFVTRVKMEAGVKNIPELEQLATKVLSRMESIAKGGDNVIDLLKAEQRYSQTYASSTTKPFGLQMTLEEVEKVYGANGKKIVQAVEVKAKELIRETGGNVQGDPVVTGLIDNKTGQMFFGRNLKTQQQIDEFVENMHVILKKRLEFHSAQITNNNLKATLNDIQRAGIPGSHSEIVAVDQALKARGASATEADIADFIIHNRKLGTPLDALGFPQGCPPRCAHCWFLSDGIKVIGND